MKRAFRIARISQLRRIVFLLCAAIVLLVGSMLALAYQRPQKLVHPCDWIAATQSNQPRIITPSGAEYRIRVQRRGQVLKNAFRIRAADDSHLELYARVQELDKVSTTDLCYVLELRFDKLTSQKRPVHAPVKSNDLIGSEFFGLKTVTCLATSKLTSNKYCAVYTFLYVGDRVELRDNQDQVIGALDTSGSRLQNIFVIGAKPPWFTLKSFEDGEWSVVFHKD